MTSLANLVLTSICVPTHPLLAAPWLASLANAVLTGRLMEPQQQQTLARSAVDNLQKLGPTFIKLGQILSIRCGGACMHGSRS